MVFLKKIDEIHKANIDKFEIPVDSKTFSSFIPVSMSLGDTSYNFLIKKKEKSRLLIICGKQRVYLSDIQIINTILTMPDEDVNWFIKQFAMFYNGNRTEISIRIAEEEYIECGINLYNPDKELVLLSDSVITYNQFIMLLNFVFSKDVCWGNIIDDPTFEKETLIKYISLIDYYHSKSEKSKNYLLSINYPIAKNIPVDRYSKHKPIAFYSEGFDISKYL